MGGVADPSHRRILELVTSRLHSVIIFSIIFLQALFPLTDISGQNSLDDPFDTLVRESDDDPFGLPFSDSTTNSERETQVRSSISIDSHGRITVIGPDQVPHLRLIGTFRLGLLGVTEQEDPPNRFRFQNSDLRIEGSALENNHFRFRVDLDGVRSPGIFSEAWIDRKVRNGIHLTLGRVPNALGLQGGLPPEDRLTISHGVLDWIDEGSSWALRAGGRWLEDAITLDLNTRLGGAADLRGDFFGGQGFSGRLALHPFAPLLFGGPTAIDSAENNFSVFISGRLDHEADGHFQIESPGESMLYRSQNLQMDSARWVRAGWRWPIFDWLHLENEWSRTGFFGVENAGTSSDFPGEIDGWQLGIRFLLSSNESLTTRTGPDLPPGPFDDLSPFDHNDLEVLVRYEKADLGDQLAQQGLMTAGTDAGGVQVLRVGVSSRSTSWFRWLLEGTSTVTERQISAFDGDDATSIRLLFEIGG